MSVDFGNRLTENKCIRCGGVLIVEKPKWNMCSVCIGVTEEDFIRIRKRKEADKDSPKRKKLWVPMLARKKV